MPALAGSLLLRCPWKTRFWFFSRQDTLSWRSLLGGLWLATRQFIHERSGLPPPSLAPPLSIPLHPSKLPEQLAVRAISLIPHYFRPSHLSSPLPDDLRHHCYLNSFYFPTLTFESEGLPQFFGQAPALRAACLADELIGILPPHSPLIAKLFKFQTLFPQPPNCSLTFKPCCCGNIHGYLTTHLPLPKNAPLHIGDPPSAHTDFILQFDGGALRTLKLGGAGVVLWKHAWSPDAS